MASLIPSNQAYVFGTILRMGGSCFISYLDEGCVHKSYEIWVNGRRRSYYPESCEEELVWEWTIYRHLGTYYRILHCFSLDEIHPSVHALRLERASWGTVRDVIRRSLSKPLPEQTRLQMCHDAADGIAYVHSRGVWHSDIRC